jgi:hypothetical protein
MLIAPVFTQAFKMHDRRDSSTEFDKAGGGHTDAHREAALAEQAAQLVCWSNSLLQLT